jgi:hypothetical protein
MLPSDPAPDRAEAWGNRVGRRSVREGVGVTRRVSGVAAVVVAAIVALAAPAAATAPDLEAAAGYVDGQIVPGRPVPVRVQIRSDELVAGTLTITPYTLGEPDEPVTTAVEVAGGSVKDYLVAVPTRWQGDQGPSEMQITLRTDDDTVEATAPMSWSGDVEVVGLLPGLVSQSPDPMPLATGLGRAVFDRLDAPALATAGALGPLGSIVAGPDGVAALPAEAQRNVLEWVEDGGHLLIDVPPGSPVAGLPEAWQPTGARTPAGKGWIRLTDGAAARGQWAEIIEPSRQFGPQEMSSDGGICCFLGVPDSVARDAGLRIPDVGWLLGFLVAYVVIVGPVTFVLLRRVRRSGLAWVAVPLVAVLFTGVAFVAGSSLRSDARASHGSVVESSPLGDRVVSYVGLVSRDGRDPTALFPEGWHAGGLDPNALSDMGDPFMVGERGVATDGTQSPVAVAGDDGRPGVKLPLSAGDFGMVTARGRMEGDSPLAVTAAAAADGTVSGTVTNGSDLDLEAVIVVVAGRAVDVGDLAAGASTDWTVDVAGPDPTGGDPWAAVEQPWSSAIGQDGEPDPDSIVNYAVYSSEIGRDIDAYPTGVAVAAGWTTDWVPPIDVGSGLAGGRTGVVARSAVTAPPGTVPAAAVRREFVRGPGATRFDPPIEIADWGSAMGGVARFTLPEGTDPATPLVLEASSGVVAAEVWDGQAWLPVELAGAAAPGAGVDAAAGARAKADALTVSGDAVVSAGGTATTVVEPALPGVPPQEQPQEAPPPIVIGGPGFDPFGPPREARLPGGVVRGGVVYVRVAMAPDAMSRVVLQVRGAQ